MNRRGSVAAPLAVLRQRLREACDRGDLAELLRQEERLRSDPRSGAQALAGRSERFRAGVEKERRRLDALHEGRGNTPERLLPKQIRRQQQQVGQ